MSGEQHLNSDGQQFHQNQQNKQPFLTSTCWEKKSPLHIVLEIQVFTLGSGQAQKFDGVKPVNGIDWIVGKTNTSSFVVSNR